MNESTMWTFLVMMIQPLGSFAQYTLRFFLHIKQKCMNHMNLSWTFRATHKVFLSCSFTSHSQPYWVIIHNGSSAVQTASRGMTCSE